MLTVCHTFMKENLHEYRNQPKTTGIHHILSMTLSLLSCINEPDNKSMKVLPSSYG